jgi:alpha-L-arabinofuranosidase
MTRTRRDLLKDGSLLAAATVTPLSDGPDLVRVDPAPLFAVSPRLHMQFMEPLGVTDGSVEAAWDHEADDWRADFVDAVADLAPDTIRLGGLFSRYYRWREGVGPPGSRPPMRNLFWGGWETNRVGTAELVDLCRRTGAEPLLCVNFLSDGHAAAHGDRTADAAEAADWVAYCNDPDHPERRRHGFPEPHGVKLWQVGNETSYAEGGFGKDEAVARTVEFARAMRARDPSVELIGWGDRAFHRAGAGPELWAGDMVDRAGDLIDMVAVHMMQQLPSRPDTALRGNAYQREPERAWEELIELSRRTEARLVELRQVLDDRRSPHGIAVTEGHLSLAPHNANPILLEWLTGAFHARALNAYQRHGRRVRIATVADFEGTRWTVVAVRVQVPRGVSHLTPAGSVARLFKRHNGREAVAVGRAPPDLDVAASRAGDRVYLHVANLSYGRSVAARFAVDGRGIAGGRVVEIAPPDLRRAVSQDEPDVFRPVERPLPAGEARWRFPAGSVSVVELDLS